MEMINNNEVIIDGKHYKIIPVEEEIVPVDLFGETLVVTEDGKLYFQDVVNKRFFLFDEEDVHIYNGSYISSKDGAHGKGWKEFYGFIPEAMGRIFTVGDNNFYTPFKRIKVTKTTFNELKIYDKFCVIYKDDENIHKEDLSKNISRYSMKISNNKVVTGRGTGTFEKTDFNKVANVYKFEVV